MIAILFDLDSGSAKLSTATTIKLGADVPILVTFSTAPGAVGTMQLALGTADAASTILAFTDVFEEVDELNWSATLDAGDTRLAAFMSGKQPATVNAELVAVLDGLRQVAANLPVTVQPAIITGGAASQGGPFDWTIKTANYTAVRGDAVQADTSAGAWTFTLPAAAQPGDAVAVEDATASFATHHLTIARNGLKINGSAADYIASTAGAKLRAVYISSAYGWSLK